MSLIARFEHLPERTRSEEARSLLEKIASQVKPIMSKRGWKVGVLAEFVPADPSLLGINMDAGQRINLRLRPPGREHTFYEYDQLVLVMLHELAHIEQGPHNAKFYKLLAELEEEFYDLKRKGFSGEGFHGQGHHLPQFKVSQYDGKTKGLQAAERRLQRAKALGKGGILDGQDRGGRDMRAILAEAAERRIRDDKVCKVSSKEVEEEVKKAQKESVGIDAPDLAGDAPRYEEAIGPVTSPPIRPSSGETPSTSGKNRARLATDSRTLPSSEKRSPPGQPRPSVLVPDPKPASIPNLEPIIFIDSDSDSSTSHPLEPSKVKLRSRPIPDRKHPSLKDDSASPSDDTWSCPACTLINPLSASSCNVCSSPRPPSLRSKIAKKEGVEGWWCEICGEGPREMSFWSCAECGTVRKWG